MYTTQQIVIEAKNFVQSKHKDISINTISGKTVKQSDHLQEVADLVWASGGSDTEIAAAWLHDTIEDTDTTIEEIKNKFGEEVSSLVDALTDKAKYSSLPTTERKEKQAEHIKHQNNSVKRIKLADQTSNIRFLSTDPKVGWIKENGYNYVLGAKKIADNCFGVSDILDSLFKTEFEKAVDRLK